MVRRLFLAQSKSESQFDADPAWRDSVRGRSFCTYCSGILPGISAEPINVTLLGPPRTPVSTKILFRAMIAVVHRAMLEVLLELRPTLLVGRCFTRDGHELQEYASCYTADPVELRGGILTHYRVCPKCGALLASVPMAEHPAPLHVYANELTEAHVHTSRAGGLLVDALARDRMTHVAFPDLEFRSVRIVEPSEGGRMTKATVT